MVRFPDKRHNQEVLVIEVNLGWLAQVGGGDEPFAQLFRVPKTAGQVLVPPIHMHLLVLHAENQWVSLRAENRIQIRVVGRVSPCGTFQNPFDLNRRVSDEEPDHRQVHQVGGFGDTAIRVRMSQAVRRRHGRTPVGAGGGRRVRPSSGQRGRFRRAGARRISTVTATRTSSPHRDTDSGVLATTTGSRGTRIWAAVPSPNCASSRTMPRALTRYTRRTWTAIRMSCTRTLTDSSHIGGTALSMALHRQQ